MRISQKTYIAFITKVNQLFPLKKISHICSETYRRHENTMWAKCEVSILSTRWYIQLPLCLSVYNMPGVCFHRNVTYRGGIRINGSNTTRALMGWRVDGRTDRRLSQLDHVGNERTSLVSDVKLNCVDWGYVQSTKQRAGW